MKKLIFSLLLLQSLISYSATHYITHQGIPPNTNSLAGLNTFTNINPGDTVRLVGTFTNGIAILGYVGDYNNPVTFLFDQDTKFSAPAWGQYYNSANSFDNKNAIFMPNVRSVVIDGGVNGLIEATSNGTMGYTWSNRCDGVHLTILSGSFEIKNLSISNLVHRNNGDLDSYTPGHVNDNNYVIGGNSILIAGGYTNSSIHNCTITEGGNLISLTYDQPTDYIQIYSNNLSHCSFGIQIYGFYDAGGSRWSVYKNNIDIGEDWSGNNSVFHGNGIICNQHQGNYILYDPTTTTNYYTNGIFEVAIPQYGPYGSYYNYFKNGNTNNISLLDGTNVYTTTVSFFAKTNKVTLVGITNALVSARILWLRSATNVGLQVYQNRFGPTWGTNASSWCGFYADMPSGFQQYKIYNNLVLIDNITSQSLMGNSISAGHGSFIANNTVIMLNPTPLGVGLTANFGGANVVNNLFYNFAGATSFNDHNSDSRGWGWFNKVNYNIYYGISEWMSGQGTWPALFYNPAGFPPVYGPGVAIYRIEDGYEDRSTTNKPNINLTTYIPVPTDTNAVLKATNLTSVAIALDIPNLTNDFNGDPRPATGPWTIGAFEVGVTPDAPVIVYQPARTSHETNDPINFSISAYGVDPMHYSWYRTNFPTDTLLFLGEGSNSIYINSVTVETNYYYCVVTNSLGSVISDIVMGAFTNGITQSPVITSQPSDTSSTTNTVLSITVIATGSSPLHYIWYRTNSPSDVIVTNGDGNGYRTFSTNSVVTPQTNYYYCIITNYLGYATSSIVKIGFRESQSAALITTNLLGWWKFNNDYLDCTTNAHDGTATGSPTFVTGTNSQAVEFVGASSQSVDFGSFTELNSAQTFTLSAWMKRSSLGATVSVGTDNGVSRNMIILDGPKVYFNVTEYAAGVDAYVASTLNDTSWHHYVLVFDGTLSNPNRITGYIDGVDVGTSDISGSQYLFTHATSGPLLMGYSPTVAKYSSGLIDSVRLFSTAINSATVTTLFNDTDVSACFTDDQPVIIDTHPALTADITNSTLSLSVTAHGTLPISYWWYYTNNPTSVLVTNGVGITSYTTNSTIAQTNYYFVVATNVVNSVTSTLAKVSFTNGLPPPVSPSSLNTRILYIR